MENANGPAMRFKIGISGSYGGLNLGDEAILESIIGQIRNSVDAEITVFSRNAEDTGRRYKVERVVPVRKLGRKEVQPDVERLDLLIIGGGGILYDAEAKTYLREAFIAQETGVPYMIYGAGAGPLRDPAVQMEVQKALNGAAIVTVRDRPSLRTLEDAGLRREITVTADPALLLPAQECTFDVLQAEGIDQARTLIGMSVREPGVAAPDIKEEHYHQLLADTADYLIDRYGSQVVFVPLEQKFDLHQAHAVGARMVWPNHARILQGNYSPGQILTIMRHFEFVVGMRLHFLIFAALQGVPFVSLPYSKKVLGFIQELHIEEPPLQYISSGRLIAHIDTAWDRRDRIREQIREFLPALQKRALQNSTLMTGWLRLIYTRRGGTPEQMRPKRSIPGTGEPKTGSNEEAA
jgi:polysaccharide pyruvyl transferase CsaB